ncbi:MAG: 5-formyltetrahydrofolate cyclo-ligase [Clostridia bacterium]|nr:5-formyltetrahydrofolate cyclo-ligase [Clostridia bacterium]
MDKKALRRAIGEKKRALSPEQIEARSRVLADRLFATEPYKACASLYAYLSFNQEVRTRAIIERAWADGKRVAVPKVIGDDIVFIWIDSFDSLAPQGAFNITEPIEDGPVADDKTALVLMPGLAFDREGHRVGYGGGYYDRFLEKEKSHPLVALCYDFQMFDQLEVEEHDVPVDAVITDA